MKKKFSLMLFIFTAHGVLQNIDSK